MIASMTRAGDEGAILGTSEGIRRALMLTARFAPTDLPVLFVGATGTGKELFARELHRRSGRGGAFVDVNCGALPREMVESLLFGHCRGAFTGAHADSVGLFEAAEGGTLLLDELGSLPAEGQAKLLRVLESGEVRRLGEVKSRQIRCRVVAASHDDLNSRIRAGALRGDLYQRLAGVVIRLPTLAERPEDILVLARSFAQGLGKVLCSSAESLLIAQGWPGNVRELVAVIQRAALLADDSLLAAGLIREALELAPQVTADGPGPSSSHLIAGPLAALCHSHGWDVAQAAAALGVGRSTLYRRLRDAGIDPSRWRSDECPGLQRQG